MSLLRAPLDLWSYPGRRICGNTGAGNENFYNFVKFSQQRGEEATLGTQEQVLRAGHGEGAWALLWAGAELICSQNSVTRGMLSSAQQFPLDIIFQNAMMLLPHLEGNYPVLKLLKLAG